MRPSFNTAGPCVAGQHYVYSPARRMQPVLRLIDQAKYFTLRAGPRSGKTTAARWLTSHLNRDGNYAAAWVDLETAGEQPDVKAAMAVILEELEHALLRDLPMLAPLPDRDALLAIPATALVRYLQQVCGRSPRPLVLLLDESEALLGPAMASFLAQLRSGYSERGSTPFPHSIALIGMRGAHAQAPPLEASTGAASPFNIAPDQVALEPLTVYEVSELLAEHTAATGQRFQPVAVTLIHELSQGQPWLVNALADQIVNREVDARAISINPQHVHLAKDAIVARRKTHLASLATRLRDERVRRVLEPMLVGDPLPPDLPPEDLTYTAELGLVGMRNDEIVVSNPIYREIIPRVLTFVQQIGLHQQTEWYVEADGSLDLVKLLGAFQELWRKHGQMAAEGFRYRVAGPHLVLTGFLQRILQKGGRVDHDYGFGRGALGLGLGWREQRHLVEVMVRRNDSDEIDGVEHVARQLDPAGLDQGYLVLFDRRQVDWQQKLSCRTLAVRGKHVHVVGC